MIQHLSKSATFASLPPPWPGDLRAEIRALVAQRPEHKVVVLDDDPTGTQTVYDIPVLARWDVETLRRELVEPGNCFYILTNSRSLAPTQAAERTREIARNLRDAVWRAAGFAEEPKHSRALCSNAFTLVSRSDSTLRGHYPLETDVLTEELGPFDATILIPYFEAGGRYTIEDLHYLADGETLIPVGETAFARDASFGYRSSNLREYIEEKTSGRIKAADVVSFSISELRTSSKNFEPTRGVFVKLLRLMGESTVIVNACSPADLEFFALATLCAEKAGARYLFRTAAQFVAARLGLEPAPLWQPPHTDASPGGLIIVGSHVPKTTEQLGCLLKQMPSIVPVELSVEAALKRELPCVEIRTFLAAGKDVVVFTSRQLAAGSDAKESLAIANKISAALVEIVRRLDLRPRYLIAKGGITSSDIATLALGMHRATVRGQIIPGVPVWELGPEAKFPRLNYIVFPGNVGGPAALLDVAQKLSSP